MENNWKFKTLENLEKHVWPALDSDESSQLIITCNSLRKIPLNDFDIEDLRIMIGQNIGLKYLIPIAIETLKRNILSEGHYYEGDLLTSVLSSERSYWINETKNHENVCTLFKQNEQTLKNLDTSWEIKKKWFELFKEFAAYNQ